MAPDANVARHVLFDHCSERQQSTVKGFVNTSDNSTIRNIQECGVAFNRSRFLFGTNFLSLRQPELLSMLRSRKTNDKFVSKCDEEYN
ncbi:hypothetical protein KM043_018227 [Ampulex compressa]|nr:hypothetical protein KM043_018227 [Ampulex compressa]